MLVCLKYTAELNNVIELLKKLTIACGIDYQS
jgi:hypothetical protein